MTAKLPLLHSLMAVAEERSADPELFAAVLALARTDAGMLTAKMTRALAGSPDPLAAEEAVVAAGREIIEARVAQIRADGVGDIEAIAYEVAVTIALVEAMRREQSEFRAAAGAPMQ